jgi:hypothetical protein
VWDLRRLIVPLTYFIEKPFYNWTRHAANYIGSVLLYLDYGAPVDRIRQMATELVAQSKLASGKVTSVQVTNTRPDSIEVRILISADSAANASNLCAELREELIAFLQREHPESLPRQRSEAIAATRKDSPPTAPDSHGDRWLVQRCLAYRSAATIAAHSEASSSVAGSRRACRYQ